MESFHVSQTLRLAAIALFFHSACLGADPPATTKSVKLVLFGDSTTAPRGKVKIYANLLKRDLPEKGIKAEIINAGAPGNTTANAQYRFKKDVIDQRPEVVVIQFGINDSAVDVWKTPPATEPRIPKDQYARTLEYFVDALQKRNCEVILMTPNPLRWTVELKGLYGKPPYHADDPDGFNVTIAPYAAAVRELAKKKKVPIVDVYAAFHAYDKVEGQSVDDLLLDGMHPNDQGHQLVAKTLIAALLKVVPEESARSPK